MPSGGTGGDGGGGSGGNGHSEKPISFYNGSESFSVTDLVVNGQFPIRVVRKYHSQTQFDSPIGASWALLLERRLFEYPDGSIVLRNTCGRRDKFVNSGGSYSSPVGGTRGALVSVSGGYELKYANGVTDTYDSLGRLTRVRDSKGNLHEYTYDSRGKLPLIGTSKKSVDPAQPITLAYVYRITRIDERGTNGVLTGRFVTFQYNESTGRMTSVTANDGRTVSYVHDTSGLLTKGNLIQVNMLDGQVATYGYTDANDPHNLTSIVEAEGRTPIVNTYDAQDRVVMQTEGTRKIEFNYETPFIRTIVTRTLVDHNGLNPYTVPSTYEFNAIGSVTKVITALGHEHRYAFSPANDLIKREIWQKDGATLSLLQTMEWTYDTTGHRLSEFVTLASGEVVTRSWTYDHDWVASEQAVSTAVPAKIFRTEYTFNYGADGRPVSIQSQKRRKDDGSFLTTSFTYDARNRLLATTMPDGVKQVNEYTGDFVTHTYYEVAGSPIAQMDARFEYDAEGRVIKQWDARNNLTQFSYDNRGRMVSRTNALGQQDLLTYTNELLTQVEHGRTLADGEGQVTKYLYDGRGRQSQVQLKNDGGAFETIQTTAYDSEDRALRSTDAINRTTITAFDLNGRVASVTDPAGKQTQFFYDAADNRIRVRDALARDTDSEFDALNRLVAIVEKGITPSARTEMTYDASGNLTSVKDAENSVTAYEYDALSRNTKIIQPLGQAAQFAYDSRDRLDQMISARGQKLGYDYEPWGAMQAEFQYPTTSASTPDRTIAYSYDVDGHVTSITDSGIQPGASFATTYDALGRPFDETVKYMPAGDRVLQHRYDRYGNRNQVALTGGGATSNSYVFDKRNRLTGATLGGAAVSLDHFANGDLQSITLPNGVTQAYTYKANGPLDTIVVNGPAGSIAQFSYAYNDVLNIVSQTDFDGVHGYAYDGLNRLTQATHPAASGLPSPENFTYTPVGDRKDPAAPAAWGYDANHRITDSPGLTYTFDAAGNLQSRSDAMSLTHDARQRLIQVVKSGTTSSYLHDAFGRRIRKTVAGATTWFLWDGSALVGEFDSSGTRTKRYSYLAGYAPAQLEDANGVYYVHADQLGTPRLVSGGSGQIVWRLRLEAFGKATPEQDSDGNGVNVTLNIRFPGQYFDAETELHYNYFRDYDPATGRYVQSDPIGLGGGLNTYGYVRANPLLRIDPLGLADCLNSCRQNCLAAYEAAIKGNHETYMREMLECRLESARKGMVGEDAGNCMMGETAILWAQNRSARKRRDECLAGCADKCAKEDEPCPPKKRPLDSPGKPGAGGVR
jgi:RHS repeat-associated protein